MSQSSPAETAALKGPATDLDASEASAVGVQRFAIVAGCFLLSGFAALLYETVWLRQFAILFGTSEQALAVVLGTYMGGLAIGSLVASRVADRLRRPLLTYGLLELGIAITALLVPVGLMIARSIQVALFGGSDQPPAAGQWSQIVFFFVAAFAVTILPTGMMGATLPLLARHVVRRDEQLGKRIGALYAINVAGAVMGTLAAAFLCLPTLGLRRTVLVGVSVNVLVFLLVWLLLRRSETQPAVSVAEESEQAERSVGKSERREPRSETASSPRRRRGVQRHSGPARHEIAPRRGESAVATPRSWILPVIALSGAISFAYEILFTRMLGHLLGGSVFAFASMLAAFLTGIAVGAGIAARLAGTVERAANVFFYTQLGIAVLALASWRSIDALAATINSLALAGESLGLPRPLLAIVVLLPPAVAIGMTFPLAIRIHARDRRDAASSSAKVYAWNTVGGVLGAMVTGTYLLPATNYQLTLVAAALGNLALALWAYLATQTRPLHLAGVAVAGAVLLVAFPGQPDALLRASPSEGLVRDGVLSFVRTGRSSTVTLHNRAGVFAFATNGLPEAGAVPKGWTIGSDPTPVWLGVLPSLLVPQADQMLVIGYGSGVAATSALDSVRQIDVFELEEGIIEANRLISGRRHRDPVTDPRLRVIMNDGRSGLALTDKHYDAIVSQPSHPWTAGASHLYTHEFAELVRDHLTEDGVFVQWMATSFVDLETLRSLAASLVDVFPHVQLFRPTPNTLLFAARASVPDQPLPPIDFGDAARSQRLAELGLGTPESLLAILCLDDPSLREFCRGARRTTDDNNLLALRMTVFDDNEPAREAIQARFNALDPVADPETETVGGLPVDRVEIARRRFEVNRRSSAEAVAAAIRDPSRRATVRGYFAMSDNVFRQAAGLFRRALEIDPENATARCLLQQLAVSVPDSIDESARRLAAERELPPMDASVIAATEDLQARRYDRMPKWDRLLARIPADSLLHPAAAELRINWRILDPEAGPARSRGEEALALIEPLLAHNQSPALLYARVSAARLADRPFVLLASAQILAQNLIAAASGGAMLPGVEPVGMLESCLAAIAPYAQDRRVSQERFFGVQMLLEQTLASFRAGG